MAIILYLIMCFITAKYGSKRNAGGMWILFFSMTFSPLIGFVIARDSGKAGIGEFKPPTIKTHLISAFFVIASIFLFYQVAILNNKELYNDPYLIRENNRNIFICLILAAGFIGAIFYNYKKFPSLPDNNSSPDNNN
ncbi:hypothetical protein ACFS6H_19795 [Terrimonas rubra]|uniref:Uncharacterized protein n=1 Tax=Terrimonas rubra TaxID=1035890 RepID=A0ABW6A9F6_9BACT